MSGDYCGIVPLLAPNLQLKVGFNYVGFPLVSAIGSASELAQAVNAQGGAVEQIDRWNQSQGRWQSFVPGLPFNNFPIEDSRGYLLKVSQDSAYTPESNPGQ